MSDNDNKVDGIDLTTITDADLAVCIRTLVKELNNCVQHAAKRELVVAYRIKAPEHGNEVGAPRIIVSVMTEVA
jgi:hypothetical protein